MAWAEVFLAGWARKFIPGTDQLAVVAAVDAIADGAAKLRWNGAFEFDGEVGNAAPRIQPIGRDDGAGGTGGQAGAAGAAMRARGRIGGQSKVQVNLAEEEIRTRLSVDQVGVLADPAQS